MSEITIPVEMTPSVVYLIVAFLLSWGLEKIPKVKDWWAATPYKWQLLLAIFVAVPEVAWLLHCYTAITILPTPTMLCGWDGAVVALLVGISAFAANQTAFSTSTRKLPNAMSRAEDALLAKYRPEH